ncbi:PP2C family protein-serine/threonine phosphatase [Sulfurirhabdus autotrophica]|uniref:Serine/threonine protein phosphatase PrpC n=1 Tax=Sulfurirhabdus autotrophica TaxID=1706046 RepID=A0A4R3XWK1_9PROT|nr:protein phosphatase 2C domain-containing protein [Sulfurirhabdus autotrophica]TCV84115.1 serine/threonine protein phosphatase PrpC [Sulfurirhabdus autotrophica]
MKFSIYQSSRQGGRKYNQDRVAYSYSKEALLMVIADGMGGHLHGEVAAQITVQMIAESFQKQAAPVLSNPFDFLTEGIFAAHHAIGDYAVDHELLENPRTTCVACVIQGDAAYWAHVGDSRLYMFRGANLISRTRDHSRVQQLFEDGKITEEQMVTHPDRNKIYNCLGGMMPPEIEYSKKTPVREGDAFLLCSDGLWGELTNNEIAAILQTYPINQALPELLDHAEFRGGEDGDNLSGVAMIWGDPTRLVQQDPVSTAAMPVDTFTTKMDTFDIPKEGGDVTEEDIERAISEIQMAIKKYTK